VVAAEHDQPGTGPEQRLPGVGEVPDRLFKPVGGQAFRDRGALAAGDYQSIECVEIAGTPYLDRLTAESPKGTGVRLEVALDGEDADPRLRFFRG
jgi:hypothetical protein